MVLSFLFNQTLIECRLVLEKALRSQVLYASVSCLLCALPCMNVELRTAQAFGSGGLSGLDIW